MSTYARPGSVEEALELLTRDGAAVLAGGTDLAGQIDRGIRSPTLLSAKKIGVTRCAMPGRLITPSVPTSTFPNGASLRTMSSTTKRCSRNYFASCKSSEARETGRVPARAMVR